MPRKYSIASQRSSSERAPPRPLRHRSSITSLETSLSNLNDENNYEMFSGAASEVVPSSISSFHHAHTFRRDSVDSEAETRSLLAPSVRETESQFNFFTVEEIENAEGFGSTLEDPDQPIDYDTDWGYSNDRDTQSVVEFEYGLTDSTSDRSTRRAASVKSDTSSHLDADLTHHAFDGYPDALLLHQRYYIAEEDLVIGIAGYRSELHKTVRYQLVCWLTFGIGYLVLRWFPRIGINMKGTPTPLGNAEWVVIETEFGEMEVERVARVWHDKRLSSFLPLEEDPVVPFMLSFEYRYLRFFYSPVKDIFSTNSTWHDPAWADLRSLKEGVNKETHSERLTIFGRNALAIREKTYLQLLVDEVLHPFYMFQVFSIFLWMADDYYYYAGCIFLISTISVMQTLVETKSSMRKMQAMSRDVCEIRVRRNDFWKQIDSTDLVPGDIYELDPSLSTVPCDSVLLSGDCVVNESMLTGESVPVSKIYASDEALGLLGETGTSGLLRSFLFNGTKILKTRRMNDEPVTALVIKTGFNTTKGALVRSMLFPKPMGFKFYADSFRYIGFMTGISAIGFVISTINFIRLGVSYRTMILRALDIITIVVPPALPATLTIGTSFAMARLKKTKVFCIAPTRVNVGGKVDVFCFDKTGTLTEDGLDVLGVHIASAKDRRDFVFDPLAEAVEAIPVSSRLRSCMATCHTLRSIDGELVGDPLDLKMFSFAGWQFEEDYGPAGESAALPPTDSAAAPTQLVAKVFEFVSQLRRMAVVVQSSATTGFTVFVKGAPEVMVDVCNPETLPANFHDLLHYYTHSGYRVIACAAKLVLEVPNRREDAECRLDFLGFIVFENKLKASTAATLALLRQAELRTVMCTGDNILTAISVGRECGMLQPETRVFVPSWDHGANRTNLVWEDVDDASVRLDPISLMPLRATGAYSLAVTGDVFRYLLTELNETNISERMLMKSTIFARMSPDEKHELVERLQKLDYTVGFCGDGANDCGALKAADVGISLSEAEASIAAPFTSRVFEISCVLDVIREGRAALVTSFSCFQYMSLYSAIQFVTVTILYMRGSNLGDFQFLYIDLCLILPIAIFMAWSKPFPTLCVKRPSANLVSPKILIPMMCNIIIVLTFQLCLWRYVQSKSWYVRPIPGDDDAVKSSDNTVLFLFSNFQYVLAAVVLTRGPPYRMPVIYNLPFLGNVLGALGLSTAVMMVDSQSALGNLLDLTLLSGSFKAVIVAAAAGNLALMHFCDGHVYKRLSGVYKRFTVLPGSKKRFKRLLALEAVPC